MNPVTNIGRLPWVGTDVIKALEVGRDHSGLPMRDFQLCHLYLL